MRLLQQMMVTIGIANISDCCVYYLAGSSNFKEADWTFKWRREVWKSKRSGKCTSQQKVDITLYFYTSFNEHNTPYTVLESDNSESMPDVLH